MLKEGDGPLALVLAPTRELAVQIHEEAVRFGHPCGVSTICIYGGVPKQPQIQALRKAPEVLIATPGRLTDLLSARKTELSRCTYVVVDEADRMLDLGFEPQLRGILNQMRADRQTLMFSATWPASVQDLASSFLLPGVLMVEVGGALAEAGKANSLIEQACSNFRYPSCLSSAALHSSRSDFCVLHTILTRVHHAAASHPLRGVNKAEEADRALGGSYGRLQDPHIL